MGEGERGRGKVEGKGSFLPHTFTPDRFITKRKSFSKQETSWLGNIRVGRLVVDGLCVIRRKSLSV